MSRMSYRLSWAALLLTNSLFRCNLSAHEAEHGACARFESQLEVGRVYKEIIEKECEQALKEYLEAESKFAEMANQFVSISKAVPGRPDEMPARPFNMGAFRKMQDAEYKVDKARKKWLAIVEKMREYYGS